MLKSRKLEIGIRGAKSSDANFLLRLRNDPETSAVSFDTKQVGLEAHLQWLTRLLIDQSRELYIATAGGRRIGSMRLDQDMSQEYGVLSWTVAPEARGKGLGKAMVKTFLEERRGKIRAQIKKGNFASAKIAVAAGMHLVEQDRSILVFERP